MSNLPDKCPCCGAKQSESVPERYCEYECGGCTNYVNADHGWVWDDSAICPRMWSVLVAARAERDRLKEFEPRILAGSPLDMRISVARGIMSNFVEMFDALNGESNYTETECSVGDDAFNQRRQYVVTVRRKDKPSAHDLRMKAEAELAATREKLAAFEAVESGRRLSNG